MILFSSPAVFRGDSFACRLDIIKGIVMGEVSGWEKEREREIVIVTWFLLIMFPYNFGKFKDEWPFKKMLRKMVKYNCSLNFL